MPLRRRRQTDIAQERKLVFILRWRWVACLAGSFVDSDARFKHLVIDKPRAADSAINQPRLRFTWIHAVLDRMAHLHLHETHTSHYLFYS